MNSEREALALRRRMLVAQARLQRLEIAGQVGAFTDRGARAFGLFSRALSLLRIATTLLPLLRRRK